MASAPGAGFRLHRPAIVGGTLGLVAVLAGIGIVLAVTGGKAGERASVVPSPKPSGLLQPSPVPSSMPSPTTATTSPIPPLTGESVSLGNGTVTVPVPTSWEASVTEDGLGVHLTDDRGDYVLVVVYQPGSDADAAAEVSSFAAIWLVGDNDYGEIEEDHRPETVSPTGSLVGHAQLGYSAVWTNGQGSLKVEGILVVLVRGDGFGVGAVIETPFGKLGEHRSMWEPVFDGAYSDFAAG